MILYTILCVIYLQLHFQDSQNSGKFHYELFSAQLLYSCQQSTLKAFTSNLSEIISSYWMQHFLLCSLAILFLQFSTAPWLWFPLLFDLGMVECSKIYSTSTLPLNSYRFSRFHAQYSILLIMLKNFQGFFHAALPPLKDVRIDVHLKLRYTLICILDLSVILLEHRGKKSI